MATVSVIIPVYNGQAFIAEAVSSALAQENVRVEVLVVDDGSTDATWEILQHFGSRIIRCRQNNRGPAAARNHAAHLATGEWLAFLDADDVWEPHKLAAQLSLADERTFWIYSDRLNIGDCDWLPSRQSQYQKLREGDIFEQLLLEGNFITLSSVLLHKSWFDRLGGFYEAPELRGVEDWDLWLRLARHLPIRLYHEPLVKYRWHRGGISRRLAYQYSAHANVVYRAAGHDQKLLARARARASEVMACYAAADRFFMQAMRWYIHAVRCWPWRMAPYKGVLKCLLRKI